MLHLFFILFFDPEAIILLNKMGDKKFATRQQAYESLRKMEERPLPLLHLAAKHHTDAEIKKRAEFLVAEVYASIKPSFGTSIPAISFLPDDYPNRKEIIEYYTIECKEDLELATSTFVEDLLKKGVKKKVLIELLDEMAKREYGNGEEK